MGEAGAATGEGATKLLQGAERRRVLYRRSLEVLRATDAATSNPAAIERLATNLAVRGREEEGERVEVTRALHREQEALDAAARKLTPLRPLVVSLREQSGALNSMVASLQARTTATLDELQVVSRELNKARK